ncbi:hypothetical protein DICVIV_01030 [Dictyocaulus viviparus]|uniref:Protein Wnt n=1 Tax=Dictyocaulus viviparus TaxID=29172 RepID=A0A0D8Y7K1_DICVI|nr:hypothetical protein DICVIV_01030 [Dictyocaulus viviparus]
MILPTGIKKKQHNHGSKIVTGSRLRFTAQISTPSDSPPSLECILYILFVVKADSLQTFIETEKLSAETDVKKPLPSRNCKASRPSPVTKRARKRLRRKERSERQNPIRGNEMVYVIRSPSYCERNDSAGTMSIKDL